MKAHSGMSLVQVLIASVVVAGLGLVVAKLVDSTTHSQQNARLLNSATEYETRIRAALLSSPVLRATRVSTANPQLAQCLADTAATCPSMTGPFIDLELSNLGGVTTAIVPKPTTASTPVAVDDTGTPCNPATQSTCRWRVLAQWRPRDASGETIQIVATLAYQKPAANPNENLIMKTRTIDVDVPKTLFKKVDLSTCGTCNPVNQIMTGLDDTGCPECSTNPMVAQITNLNSQITNLNSQLNNYSTQITNLNTQITNLTNIVNKIPANPTPAPAPPAAQPMPYSKAVTISFGCGAGGCSYISPSVQADCPGGTALQSCSQGAGTSGVTPTCNVLGNSCYCAYSGPANVNAGSPVVGGCGFGQCSYTGALVAQATCK